MLLRIRDFVFQQWKSNKGYLIVSCFFLFLYATVSIVNYLNFRTYTLDLGLYTSALWDYSHLQFNDGTTFHNFEENLLADHFDLYLMLISPLSYLFGSYTLLLVQFLFIFIGGAGILKVLEIEKITARNSILALISFYIFFGIYTAVGFDYHSNVVATMLVPWLIFHIRKEQYTKGLTILLFIFIAKENMSIWMFFVAIGLAVEDYKNKQKIAIMLGFMVLSASYFVVITKLVMPHFSASGTYHHFHYDVLGKDVFEAIKTLLSSPLSTLKYLVLDNEGQPSDIKIEFITFFLLSGGILIFTRTSAIIMVLPLIFQKLFHNNLAMWSIMCQYSVEFAPIVILTSFSIAQRTTQFKLNTILPFVLLGSNLFFTIKLMDRVKAPIAKENLRIYAKMHYNNNNINLDAVAKGLALIPKNAAVSAQDPLTSQLAWRDKIYQYPIIRDAEYIVYSKVLFNTYPLKQDEFQASIQNLLNSGNWKFIVDSQDVSILTRSK